MERRHRLSIPVHLLGAQKNFTGFIPNPYICSRQVLYGQLLLNLPRVGIQQG